MRYLISSQTFVHRLINTWLSRRSALFYELFQCVRYLLFNPTSTLPLFESSLLQWQRQWHYMRTSVSTLFWIARLTAAGLDQNYITSPCPRARAVCVSQQTLGITYDNSFLLPSVAVPRGCVNCRYYQNFID